MTIRSANSTGTISAIRGAAIIFAASLSSLLWISPAQAQNPFRPQLGVSVQLPVIRNFSVQTSVRVPDGGTMPLGGIGRSAEGRTSSGVPGLPGRPFRNSATGRSTSAAGATVTTRIISMRELEAELMGTGPLAQNPLGPQDEEQAEIERFADYLSAHVGRNQLASRGPGR